MNQFANFQTRRLIIVAVALAGAASAQDQVASTTANAKFQSSLLTGLGDTVNALRVPVTDSTGKVNYFDVTLQFEVSPTGVLTLVGSPAIVKSPNLITAGFKAGSYVGPSSVLGGNSLITVSGPGVLPGGSTKWSLAASAGANSCTYPTSAVWYVFNGSMANHPLAATLKKAGITAATYAQYSWGTIGSEQCSIGSTGWLSNGLLGLSQIGPSISITSFSTEGTDQSQPADSISYSLKQ